nr:immunoglobulin heavy chain junction region [Macaca mulatta]MOX37751.1 immunoglobulin heavy chain junction region [Macaca mulatta]MOX37758.1 immunoglobulin heavy chain junction region [Macaca mulatta]MOX37776.1 immunoglobulin heavy chain junction region [Macaca mulatta]MOX37820.1 immunoglobulin heavy chain junction region [Macaca mulatta]
CARDDSGFPPLFPDFW